MHVLPGFYMQSLNIKVHFTVVMSVYSGAFIKFLACVYNRYSTTKDYIYTMVCLHEKRLKL